ncbi:MAG: thiol-disulfide oxidoreductase DCC family protein [Bacteroidota bacterium]|nr:thiol-disulfide oxidoreductase DCC family protein [Bacteroidota bacterium]MDP4230910.1 thiol-disulfide oxidoreductase DCC family protein [Bacteroidota bacterium]MDP4235982.1 thiol-disulfide oxidoreductase DCC family protein [Bacteroidota bacterium]
MSNAIVLFDGICNFCNSTVNFIIDHDPKKYFLFAPLQSEKAQDLLGKYDLGQEANDTFVLIEDGKAYLRSTAVLRIARNLSGIWRLANFLLVVPRFLRDPIYRIFSNSRYRLFGKREHCMIPSEEEKARFL